MAHIVGESIADKQDRINKLKKSALTIGQPAIARETLLKAAELERELEAEKSDRLEKGAKWTRDADGRLALSEPEPVDTTGWKSREIQAQRLIDANRPTIQKMLDDVRQRSAAAPPIGMPTRPPASTSVEPQPAPRRSPESMPPAERAAYYRRMAETVQDRNTSQGYREKAAQADKEGI